jgi:hypothetical protein
MATVTTASIALMENIGKFRSERFGGWSQESEGEDVKAISIMQPHASLVAIRAKHNETRSWATKYRGPLVIHASAKMGRKQKELCLQEPFATAIYDLVIDGGGLNPVIEFDLGAIIATCNLVDIYAIAGYKDMINVNPNAEKLLRPFPGEPERSFGDYTPGRYAWILADMRQIEPIPCKGKLGLWNVPTEIEEMIKHG